MPRGKKTKKARPSDGAKDSGIDTKGVWVPEKHLAFARSVLEDQRRNQERADKAAAEAQKAAELGMGVSMEARINAAAFEQAQAELK